ncbi:hypothetical protein OG225_12515 [Nocardia sp. NBC_01377]|uniref:hypothetical protein n=1 Tax=Nocardia sp. NBC_01377 TaxID=2903595 RepID=UPI00324F78B6
MSDPLKQLSDEGGIELRDFAQLGFSAAEVARSLTARDVRAACDVRRLVLRRAGSGK